ncbi:MAG: hypothetical protein ABFD64_11890 [Armatimonadota bacterium]
MRKVTSVILAISFIAMFVTVVSMMSGHEGQERHRGRPAVASAVNAGQAAAPAPTSHGRSGFFPEGLHKLAGVLILVFGLIHIFYNGRTLLSYVGIRPKHQ